MLGPPRPFGSIYLEGRARDQATDVATHTGRARGPGERGCTLLSVATSMSGSRTALLRGSRAGALWPPRPPCAVGVCCRGSGGRRGGT